MLFQEISIHTHPHLGGVVGEVQARKLSVREVWIFSEAHDFCSFLCLIFISIALMQFYCLHQLAFIIH